MIIYTLYIVCLIEENLPNLENLSPWDIKYHYFAVDIFRQQYDNVINYIVSLKEGLGGFWLDDVNVLLEQAIQESKNLISNETFLVKDLFKGYEWNRIPRKNRLLLGTLFLNSINKLRYNIDTINKTNSGQQRYRIK
jgi:hypothetical protein